MKLIDRDKFIGDMFDFYIENKWSPRDIHFSLLDVQSNIDSPEFEVKAIPVEWIEKWLMYWTRILPEWGCRPVISAMLKDWEKENSVKISEGNYNSNEDYEKQMRCLDEN